MPAAEDCPDSVFIEDAVAICEDLGFAPVVVDISEFEKLEGCVTCLSVLLPGPSRPTPGAIR